jgi:3'(2'), 5'-bisphosphate nucleotidase
MLDRTRGLARAEGDPKGPSQGEPVADFDIAACVALIDPLAALAARAAIVIRQSSCDGLRRKADGSPVTAADEAAEAVICEGLQKLVPDVPVISEEQMARGESRALGSDGLAYFLVDPLDGTREFIAGRNEFTVNIALMHGGVPILGVIVAPAFELMWRGVVGHGADRMSIAGRTAPTPIQTRPRPPKPVVVVSRSHLDPQTIAYLQTLPQAVTESSGSSLKFCRIAEGTADLYPRLAPTRDWDIAAGHAIVQAAGGTVTDPDGSLLVYGTPDLLIPHFVATGDPRMT